MEESLERVGYRMSRKLDQPIQERLRHRMTTVRLVTLALLDSVVLSSCPDVNQWKTCWKRQRLDCLGCWFHMPLRRIRQARDVLSICRARTQLRSPLNLHNGYPMYHLYLLLLTAFRRHKSRYDYICLCAFLSFLELQHRGLLYTGFT